MSLDQKKSLIEFIENIQAQLADISLKEGMESRTIQYYFEFYINTFLFQLYTIEILATNKGSRTPGSDNKILEKNFKSKYELLKKLKHFTKIKAKPLRRIYIPKGKNEKRPISIPTILVRATQQLFLLILDPIIEAHSDPNSYGFRKGRHQIMAIGKIQKSLQSKPSKELRSFDTQYI
jgi:RNA-directed DNA polymerase